MKIRNIYQKILFLTLLIFISACNQDSQNKKDKDKVLNYSEGVDTVYLHSTAKVEVDFHSASLFMDSIDSAHQALYKAGLLESTKFFNYATVKDIRSKNGMTPKPPAPIYYVKKMSNENTFFTIGLRIPGYHGAHLGQLEIVVRAHDLAPQGLLVYRVNHHERDNFSRTYRRRYYRFVDATVENVYGAETSDIKLKNISKYLDTDMSTTTVYSSAIISKHANTVLSALQLEPDNTSEIIKPYFEESVSAVVFLSLGPLLDYRIQEAVLELVRTDYYSKSFKINSYSEMMKQWEELSYLKYIAAHPDQDVRQPGKPSILPQSPMVFMNIVKY
ncbi:hypothetical protein [Borreliella japonica]|uniref:hypothetical protein n=1 Tax=Borreliella japonica TaxID=34095 RepID=UPI003AEF9F0A